MSDARLKRITQNTLMSAVMLAVLVHGVDPYLKAQIAAESLSGTLTGITAAIGILVGGVILAADTIRHLYADAQEELGRDE